MTSIGHMDPTKQYELWMMMQDDGEPTFNLQGPEGTVQQGLTGAQAAAVLESLGLPGLFENDQLIIQPTSGSAPREVGGALVLGGDNILPDGHDPADCDDEGTLQQYYFSSGSQLTDAGLLFAALSAMRERAEKMELAGLTQKDAARKLVTTAAESEVNLALDQVEKMRESATVQFAVGIAAAAVEAVAGGLSAGVGEGFKIAAAAVKFAAQAISLIGTYINDTEGAGYQANKLGVDKLEMQISRQLTEGWGKTVDDFIEDTRKSKDATDKLLKDYFQWQYDRTRMIANG